LDPGAGYCRNGVDPLWDGLCLSVLQVGCDMSTEKQQQAPAIQAGVTVPKARDCANEAVQPGRQLVVHLAADGLTVRCASRDACDVLGCDAAALCGQTIGDLLAENSPLPGASAILRARETGEMQTLVEVDGCDGPEWCVTVEPVPGESEAVAAFIYTARDMTAARAAEEELIRTRRELTILNQAYPALSASLDLDHVLITILDEAQRLIQVVGCSVWLQDVETGELVCRQAAGVKNNVIRDWRLAPGQGIAGWVVRKGEPVVVPDTLTDEHYFQGVDNQTGTPVRSIMAVPLRAKHEVIGVLQVVDSETDRFGQDDLALAQSLAGCAAVAIENARLHRRAELEISERRRSQEDLASSRESFRNVVSNNSDGILVVSPDGEVRYANPAAEALFGCSVEALRDGRFKYPVALRAGFAREVDIESVDRGRRITEMRTVETGWEGEKGFMVAIRDITDNREVEEQLRQSQKMEAIGKLAGGVAHDFNNLLMVILTSAEFVKEELEEGTTAQADINDLLTAAMRAANLTRQLLAFSRQQALEPRVVELNEHIGHTQKMLRRIIGEDIELSFDGASELGLVKVDPGQIDQVIMNLAVNARDAMPRGGILSLSTCNEQVKLSDPSLIEELGSAFGEYVVISVGDTGHGMSDEVKSRVFEPFFTTKERGRGTGLGLSTVYGIVRQHEGYIRVETAVGQGTTFKVYVPRFTDEDQAAEDDAAKVEVPHGTETVMVVEDEESVRRMMAKLVGSLGYKVIQAPSAATALELLEQTGDPIDLLLTDVVMPDVDGVALADQVRAVYPEMKVLFASGYTNDQLSGRGLDENAAILMKPFTRDRVAWKIREMLDGAPPAAQP